MFDKADPTVVLWDGVVSLKRFPLFTEHANGLWIHSEQIGIPRDQWAAWFFNGHTARLVSAKEDE